MFTSWQVLARKIDMNLFLAEGGLSPIMMFALMGGVWLFIFIIPMRKEKKKKAAMMETLKKGDRILFTSGLIAKLVENKTDSLIVDSHGSRFEILTNTVVKVLDLKTDS